MTTRANNGPSTLHARQRAGERFNRQLSRRVAQRIIDEIQAGRSERGRRQTHSRSIHTVVVDGIEWTVVYSRERKRIITVLPEAPPA